MRFLFVAGVLALSGGAAGAASLDALSLLKSINNIVLNDLQAGTETEGTVYVGGNYSGAAPVNSDNLGDATVGGVTGALIVGGSNGGAPNVNNGATVIAGDNNGQINANGATGDNAVTVGGDNNGFVQTAQPGAISVGGANNGTLNAQGAGSVATNTGVTPSVPVAEMIALFQSLSLDLSLLADTAGAFASTSDQNQLRVTSGSETIAIVNTTSALVSNGTFLGVNDFAGQTTIVNIAGKNITVGANGNNNEPNLLFNFFEAETVTFNRSFNASFLAPFANVTLNGGGVNGTFVSFNMTQNAEIRPYNDANLFGGDLPAPVPLPAAAWMLLAGLGGLFAASRRKTAA
ncbi:collagen-binding domain-containing protein [Rubrimonas cliftonensis]|uniref:VPLPA-CTERM protein sorting domain-containing protein n=1 Tax=Rubrimonas cliftonensis TaxID=89524 RepID=A0A1H4DYZ2_9RHOB|nr:collagen-binding domain-containing protein [Rubrimonas cliftonensis]SEA77728.1 VPLPA-CTERM protein sorting domain-containing protein [Rubrimonas cliftonensis]